MGGGDLIHPRRKAVGVWGEADARHEVVGDWGNGTRRGWEEAGGQPPEKGGRRVI